MVGACELPVEAMLDVAGVCNRQLPAEGVGPGNALRMSVRIKNRRSKNNRGFEDAFDLVSLRSREVINERQRCIHAAGLGAMYAKIYPRHARHVVTQSFGTARLRQRNVLSANSIEAAVIARRGRHEKQDWPALMRMTDYFKRQAVAQTRHVFDVVNQFVMADRRIAQWASEKLLGCRNRWVVNRAGRIHVDVRVAYVDVGYRRGKKQRASDNCGQARSHSRSPENLITCGSSYSWPFPPSRGLRHPARPYRILRQGVL